MEPLISFHAALGSGCPSRRCKLPTVREYTRAFRAFRARWPEINVISPWNEANHRSQPTFKNPKRAAQFYNVVRRYCRGCKIVAADVIDEVNMERWLQRLQAHREAAAPLGAPQLPRHEPAPRPAPRRDEAAAEGRQGDIWLTETGGIVKFRLPSGGTLFPYSEPRANRATKRMFALASRYRGRIKRLYIYHWKQARR